MKELDQIREKIPEFGKREFHMPDFINFIRQENKPKEKIKLWYADIPYNGMLVSPGTTIINWKTRLFHIVLDDKMDKIDQEFTLAHELAHYLLGHYESDVFYGEMSGDKKEFLANLVCFIFLLPGKVERDNIGKLWTSVYNSTADDFAYELANNYIDPLKNQIKACIRLRNLPLREPLSDIIRDENIKKIHDQVVARTNITALKNIINTILETYPKKK